jgi:hypothetical protein
MVTTRQKRTLKNIRKYPSRKEAMIEANYSPSYASSSHIKRTQGWQELMEKYLPDKDLAKVHKEGLNAKRIFSSHTEPDKLIEDYPTRHKYLELAYKIKRYFDETEQPNNYFFTIIQKIINAEKPLIQTGHSEVREQIDGQEVEDRESLLDNKQGGQESSIQTELGAKILAGEPALFKLDT